jgi:UDP-N-acetylmuramoylalanine-D-glutamate ligase
MIPVSTLAGRPVAVVGLGGSGLPTARALHRCRGDRLSPHGMMARPRAPRRIAEGIVRLSKTSKEVDWAQL